MNSKKKCFYSVIATLCVCIIVYSIFNIYIQYQAYKTAGAEYGGLAELAYGDGSTVLEENAGAGTNEPYTSPIDFAALWKINPDVVGWIVVDGTTIDYPVVQGRNNDTYLNTTFSGISNASGAIFLDYRNAPDFTDKNSIIYGHKMKNNTMFQGLSEYKSQDFLEQYPAFILYTPIQEYRCEVFAAYVTPSVSETYVLEFDTKTRFVQYLNTAINRSLVKTGTELYSNDRVVTLSTCDYSFSNARMVIHAKLIV